MRKTIIRTTIAACVLAGAGLLTGCASNFAKPAATADYGQPPDNYETVIKQYFEDQLKDPDSAKYRFGAPHKAYGNEGALYGGGIRWTGYLVKVQINSRNGFGGYVGYKPYMVLFENNKIRSVLQGDSHVLIHEVD